MEIRWLEDFIALAETQHFSRAAEKQNVTQPTFSRRIKLLEEEMGVQLVDRNTLPLSLTSAGEHFLTAAERITRTLREARSECLAIKDSLDSKLNFATTQTLFLSYYKRWLSPLSEKLEIDLELNLRSTSWTSEDFNHALRKKQCDFILTYWHPSLALFTPQEEEGLEYVKIADEKLIPVSSLDANGQPRFTLPGTRRKPIPLIAYHESAFLHPVLQDELASHRHPPHLQVVNQNFHSVNIKAMIKEGFGIGWVPACIAEESLHYKRLAFAGGQDYHIPLEIRLYRRKDCPHPNLLKLFTALREPHHMSSQSLSEMAAPE